MRRKKDKSNGITALYERLSRDDDNAGESNSIVHQKQMLEDYAMKHGFTNLVHFTDDGWSGATFDRPSWNRLVEGVKNGEITACICKDMSRIGRDHLQVGFFTNILFREKEVRFIAINNGIDSDRQETSEFAPFLNIMNEWFVRDTSKKIKAVLKSRGSSGNAHTSNIPPYGYLKDPENPDHWIIDEEAAEVVREVFTLFSQGYGKTAIARMLNDRGIPNPTEYKRLHGLRYKQPKTKNSTLWKYFAISDMLVNEIYIGNMVQGKYGSVSYKTKQNKPRPKDEWYRVEGTHEPIIDRELWDRVQALVAQKAKPFTVGTIGLFARKARCMNCGYTMRSSKNHGKHYLQCSNRHVAKDACIGSFISVDKLEKAVIDELNKLSAEYLDKDELEQNVQFNNDLRGQKEALETEIAAYQKKIAEYTKGIRELYLDKVKGILSELDYLDLSKDFSTQKERLEKLMIDTQKQLDVIERKMLIGDNRRQLIEQYTNLEHLDRETVEKLIDYVLVGKKDPVTKEVPIEIHWNF